MIFALDATAPSAPPVPGGRAGSREDLAAAPDSTRERVKQTISEHGPVTAGELAQRLGLTPAAVRRHLESLAEAGLVEEHEKAGAQVRRAVTTVAESDLSDLTRDRPRAVHVAAVGGALFMLWVDVAARTIVAPQEIPLSVVTGLVGAPVFLLLLGRRHYTYAGGGE